MDETLALVDAEEQGTEAALAILAPRVVGQVRLAERGKNHL